MRPSRPDSRSSGSPPERRFEGNHIEDRADERKESREVRAKLTGYPSCPVASMTTSSGNQFHAAVEQAGNTTTRALMMRPRPDRLVG